jgi:hypothetical protein
MESLHDTTAAPSSPEAPPTVTLGKREFVLEIPASYAARVEAVALSRTNWRRAHAMALGICVPRLSKFIGIDYAACDGNPAKYGGEVIDRLVAAGVAWDQVAAAGLAAWTYVAGSVITDKELAETKDFFGRTEVEATSRS